MKWIVPILALKLVVLVVLIVPQAISQERCNIDQQLRDLIGQKIDQTSVSGARRELYVSNVSFMDGVSKTQILSEEGRLIDEAVRDGMQAVADTKEHVRINDPQHTVPNNDGNVQRLVSITFDPSMSQDGKYRQIVSELMDPHSVDILVSGMVIDTGSVIQVRPMGISRPDNLIKTRDLQYSDREQLFQRVNETLALTPKAHEEIQKAVREILEDS